MSPETEWYRCDYQGCHDPLNSVNNLTEPDEQGRRFCKMGTCREKWEAEKDAQD